MADNTPAYVSASYSLPPEFKERIEKMAVADFSNPSVVMRRILADYFRTQPTPAVGTPAPHRTTAPDAVAGGCGDGPAAPSKGGAK